VDVEALLPRSPAGYQTFPVDSKRGPGILRVYARIASGFVGSTRRIWTSTSSGEPLVLEAVILVYESRSVAEKAWRAIPKNPDFYQLSADPVNVSLSNSDEICLDWSSEGLRFCERTRLSHGAIMSCVSSGRSTRGHDAMLQSLHQEIAERLPQPGRTVIPLLVRQLLLGAGIALVLFVPLGLFFEPVTGMSAGWVIVVAGVAFLFYCSVLPRLKRKDRVRTALKYGDTDGGMRKALASLGADLP
jgi:hypothetical protein